MKSLVRLSSPLVLGIGLVAGFLVMVESLSTIQYKTGLCDWVLDTTCKKCCIDKGFEAKHSTIKPIAKISPNGGCTCGKSLLEMAKSSDKVKWIGKTLAAFNFS